MSVKMMVPQGMTCAQEVQLAKEIAHNARALAKMKGVAAPKRITFHGHYGNYIIFLHRSNAFRDCLAEAIQSLNLNFIIQ